MSRDSGGPPRRPPGRGPVLRLVTCPLKAGHGGSGLERSHVPVRIMATCVAVRRATIPARLSSPGGWARPGRGMPAVRAAVCPGPGSDPTGLGDRPGLYHAFVVPLGTMDQEVCSLVVLFLGLSSGGSGGQTRRTNAKPATPDFGQISHLSKQVTWIWGAYTTQNRKICAFRTSRESSV
jgi:hypothetical protein